jgi:hypothetical protein
MENPFETGHIKNYILFYSAVVIIMVLFFIAATLFNDVDKVEKKVFDTDISNVTKKESPKEIPDSNSRKFKLLDSSY